MISWIRRQFNKVAKWWLDRQAPPGEFIVYINEQEEQLLKKHGGAGVEWQDTGIKSFFIKKIFRAAKRIVKSAVKVAKKVVTAVVKPILKIADGFMGLFGMSFDAPEMPSPENFDNTQQGILVNKQSNVANIPVVYGTRKVGGTRVFVSGAGDNSKYLYVCLVIAEGEIDSYTRLFINDEEQSLDSFATGGTRTIKGSTPDGATSSYYTNGQPRAKFEFFTGTETQTASSLLKEHPDWTDAHRLQGVAYVACRFEWVKAEFDGKGNQTTSNPWSGVPSIQVVVNGKKVLASGSYSASDDTTTDSSTYESTTGSFTFSDNPADCLMDYLRNPRYGKGLNNNRISFADFKAAADTCDLSVTYGGSLGSAEFLTCDTVISTSDTILNNTKKLLQSCRGFMPYTDGKYRLKIEADESTSGIQEITDDHIVSNITVASVDKNSRYNQAKVTFANEKKDFESDTVIYQDSSYLTKDGGEDLILQVSAPSITRRERATYYGKYLVDRSRRGLTCSFTMTNEGQNLKPGDLVKLTHRFKRTGEETGTYEYMFENKVFRVLEVALNYDNTASVDLIEHDGTIFSVTALTVDPVESVSGFTGGMFSGIGKVVRPVNTPGEQDRANGNARADVKTSVSGNRAGVIFTPRNTDALANTLHIELRHNGRGVTATTIPNFSDGRDYPVFQTAGRDFKPGDNIKYKLYTRRGAGPYLSFFQSGSVTFGGSNSSSTFSQSYSNQGWT